MIRAFIAAGALLCLLIVPASAKPRHVVVQQDCFIICPEQPVSAKEARRRARGLYLEQRMPIGKALDPGESAARFIRGRLVCARNIGAELARRGIQGTGSALAKSYLHWGRPSGPQPGAVAVFSRGKRGGHVAIVQEVHPDGTVIYLNPSSRRQAWHVGPYHKRPIAYRVAG